MEVFFKQISESEFKNNHSIPVLFYESLYSRYFGILKSQTNTYKFGWHSTITKPVIKKIDGNVYGIGIDQNFAVVDFLQNKILLNLNLPYNFFELKIYENNIFICTELEILVVDKIAFTIVHSIGLPDYFEDIIFEDRKMKIICIDQTIIEQNI